MRLDVMKRVENNHAGSDRYVVFDQLATVTITAKDFEGCVRHDES